MNQHTMEYLSIENASPDLSFPWRLYILLRDSEKEFPDVVSWMPNSQGRVFRIHDIKAIEPVLEKYFTSGRYTSFRRQLIVYGFSGLGNRQYMHEEFQRGNPQGCEKLFRGTKSQLKKGQNGRAVKAKQQSVQRPLSLGPPNPEENTPFMGYAKMLLARVSQMASQISPTLSPVYSASPREGVSISPETLQLSPSPGSPQGSISPTPQLKLKLQQPLNGPQKRGNGHHCTYVNPETSTPLAHKVRTSGASSVANPTFASPPLPYHAAEGSIDDDANDEDDDLIGMDFEPLPLEADFSVGSSTAATSLSEIGDIQFDRHGNLPIMTDVLDDFVDGTRNLQVFGKESSRNRWSADDLLQNLWISTTARVSDLLEPTDLDSLANQQNDLYCRDDTLESLLEPRRIEEMVANPLLGRSTPSAQEIWLDYCPSMTPEQQGVIEYMLPVILPALFYLTSISSWGHAWALLLVVGHSLECLCTDWGGSAWAVVRWIGLLQHLQIDLLWNHAMISSFFLLGPSVFGKNCYYVALGLVPTLPVMILADLKSHFNNCILTDDEKKALEELNTKNAAGFSAVLLRMRLGGLLQRSTMSYVAAMFLLAVSSFFGNIETQIISVFFFNACPLLVDFLYWRDFSKRLGQLPRKQRTVICQCHIHWLRTRLVGTASMRSKVKLT